MSNKLKAPEEIVLTRLLRLNAVGYGTVSGLVAGLGLFVSTNWLVIKDGDVVGPHLQLLGQYFPGYKVTFTGSCIGLSYAFALAFCVGYCVARIYNFLIRGKDKL